jgi:hypothetical protein
MFPEKLVIVTARRQSPHQTFDSSILRVLAGMDFHNLAAGAVNLGRDSMAIFPDIQVDDGNIVSQVERTNLGSSHHSLALSSLMNC